MKNVPPNPIGVINRRNGCGPTVAGKRLRYDQVEKACEYKLCKLKMQALTCKVKLNYTGAENRRNEK
ncbi:hypothetical protein [Methanosarcina sp.]|uniref:hypothetical protein n=1 Tax=Methanosarcina sp. TaxID=2213 RepID=UPI002989494D|nr:hypothetical protein [Methanosarcina sp.]MDW5550075.1 hypothetical protein [Methanosarcina sp.]MDW5554029.1 hypothetical protein [Methanosarcina sp.]MDW5558466.1 hypothetical protein [Methanosarcina sp.]